MITITDGDILDTDCTAVVNPLTCEGISTNSVHAQICDRYPSIKEQFDRCYNLQVFQLGEVTLLELPDSAKQKYVISLPTKSNFKTTSNIADIQRSLYDLKRVINEYQIDSIAIPAIGCGNGCLEWSIVSSAINRILGDCTCTIKLYRPQTTKLKDFMM